MAAFPFFVPAVYSLTPAASRRTAKDRRTVRDSLIAALALPQNIGSAFTARIAMNGAFPRDAVGRKSIDISASMNGL